MEDRGSRIEDRGSKVEDGLTWTARSSILNLLSSIFYLLILDPKSLMLDNFVSARLKNFLGSAAQFACPFH
jgi:hypothetical protein